MSEQIMKALDNIELKMSQMSDKATAEIKEHGKVLADTKSALENLGTEQRTLADRLLQLEQKGSAQKDDDKPEDESVGELFTKHAGYENFQKADGRVKTRVEVKNTVTNTVANTFSDRRPNIIEGAFRVFTLEDLMTRLPTSSNAIDYVKENVFTNAAAEAAEGVARGQSSITFVPGQMPVSTISHWIKISRQLAMDNSAMAAYINRRMVYGVDLKVENQIVAGTGVAQISGLTAAGNYVAHGYTAALLTAAGLANNRFDLIGKMIGDCAAADAPAEVIILNTVDWWTLRLAKDSTGRYILGDPGVNIVPMLFGLPVVACNAMTAGKVWVGPLSQAVTLWVNGTMALDLSDSDGDNFTSGLVTVRAERRAAVTVDKPFACRYGDLVPA